MDPIWDLNKDSMIQKRYLKSIEKTFGWGKD